MASSPAPLSPSPPADPRPNSSELNYFIASVAAVALLLLLYNAIAVGWCSRHCPLCWWSRRLRRNQRGAAAPDSPRAVAGMIPTYRYRKEDSGEKGGGSDEEGQCAVCLSAFVEGEDLRRLPKCGHSFHAACIDLWLGSHASCPLCRASVLVAPVPAAGVPEEDPPRVHHAHPGLGRSPPNPALIMALV